jgi:hypothetical protein
VRVVDALEIIVEEMAAPDAECLSLKPADTHHRIVVIGRRAEIIAGEVVVHGIGVVVNPAEGIGIHIDSLLMDESCAVVQATGTGSIHGTAVLFLVLNAGLFAGCIGIVNPIIFIVQLGSINLTTAEVSVLLSHIEIVQSLAGLGFVPADLGFLVQLWGIERFTILVLFNLIFTLNTCLGQHSADDGVCNPEYELAILVIGDLGFIHEERRHLHSTGLRGDAIGVVLNTGTHAEVTLVDKDHTL